MTRRITYSVLGLLMILGAACKSLNQATPKGMDDAAIETEVRAKIAEDVPEKTFAVEVTVHNGVVTLSGHAKSEAQRRQIGDAANDVKGVRTVINNITIQP